MFKKSVTFSSYFIIHLYKRIIILIIIALSASSGIFFPTQLFAHAPTVPAAMLQKSKQVSRPRISVVKIPPVVQVMELAVGEKKVMPTPTVIPTPISESRWGVATQIDEHTWTMQVQADSSMASVQDILSALNTYRVKNGKQSLSLDTALAYYAQSRADLYVHLGNTDKHAGFMDFMNHQDGFKKLGFNALGENSSYGYTLQGVHLIEWVYAGDKPHDDNQLSSSWSHVGIGVKGSATDLIFGGKKQ